MFEHTKKEQRLCPDCEEKERQAATRRAEDTELDELLKAGEGYGGSI